MKLNWNIVKVIVAFVVVIGALYWAASSLLTSSYSGTALNFGIGSGPVTVTNPSDEPVLVQLVAPRTSSFAVSSATEGMSGSATREGTGATATYILELELPPGNSEFVLTRGRDVNFVADSTTQLKAAVIPLNVDSARIILIVALVIVLGSLFYASQAVGHGWIRILRGPKTVVQDTEPVTTPAG